MNNSNNGIIYSAKKILIGTPIHQIKDYCMERWTANVAALTKITPADILLVDNSPGPDYLEKIKKYCKKYKLNPQIMHFEISQGQSAGEKIARSREIIRQYIMLHGYDAWFSWESDQIIPADTLKILTNIMEAGDYTMVHPSSWTTEVQIQPEVSFGICLIRREPLIKNGFLPEYLNTLSLLIENDEVFKKRVLNEGGSYIEVYGLIKPIYHLTK